MSGISLSIATVASGSLYETHGYVTPPGSATGMEWMATVGGTVAPTASELTVYNGMMAQQITTTGGSAVFTDTQLLSLGVPDNAAGLAVSGQTAGAWGGNSVSDYISYQFFHETLPAGVSFVLWDSGAGESGQTASFTFTADGPGNQPLGTAGWTYEPMAPFAFGTSATVQPAGGIVNVTQGTGAIVTNPDAVVVVQPNVAITALTVRATTGPADTWGLSIVNAVAQNGAPCFLAGTTIMTPSGPVAVERLTPGDPVLARFAGVTPVVWLGRRRLAPRRHACPESVWPFRILRDAVAPGVPARDLLLSPDHAVFLGGVLIPVKYLANGQTIFQDRSFETVEYWHVELARHDVLLAEALPAETYLDTGNRAGFDNAGPALALHPVFGRPKSWEKDACAPLWGEGGPVDHVRARLLVRARELRVQRARAAAAATAEG